MLAESDMKVTNLKGVNLKAEERNFYEQQVCWFCWWNQVKVGYKCLHDSIYWPTSVSH